MSISKTRQMFVDVARQIFAKKGIANTTMNDIAEELCSEVSVSHYGFFYHTQVGVDEFDNLVVGRYSLRCYLVQLVRQAFQLGFYNSVINVVLTLKVGV